eukprot:GFUD01037577.1.p1 GENE.GFUD01037577.1~~GFUD01037577.1.p1  ORF type:complete len:202 (+),score=18.63 GFUD01037577.1:36-641(+)
MSSPKPQALVLTPSTTGGPVLPPHEPLPPDLPLHPDSDLTCPATKDCSPATSSQAESVEENESPVTVSDPKNDSQLDSRNDPRNTPSCYTNSGFYQFCSLEVSIQARNSTPSRLTRLISILKKRLLNSLKILVIVRFSSSISSFGLIINLLYHYQLILNFLFQLNISILRSSGDGFASGQARVLRPRTPDPYRTNDEDFSS